MESAQKYVSPLQAIRAVYYNKIRQLSKRKYHNDCHMVFEADSEEWLDMEDTRDASFITSMTYEAAFVEYEDFPQGDQPVWILGCKYDTMFELEEIKHDIRSRIWFTYRRGFMPIGGSGPSSDSGWGCMLRCGQMMLAQALLNRHVTRAWRWRPEKYDPRYQEVLRMFQDKKSSPYSIHQIANMGVSEGKGIGQWFGPNTVAQVLKKLAVYDEWSQIVIHVAMDNTVIKDDIRTLCKCRCGECQGSDKEKACKSKENLQNGGSMINGDAQPLPTAKKQGSNHWRPLLLIIPLRLGLTDINPVYISSLKQTFTFPQSVGIIGGKPNHAHWFIGVVGEDLLYLDPHTEQPHVDITNLGQTDETFHCPYHNRLRINQLDPSVALGFFCNSEADFEQWCDQIHDTIISNQKTPMFEIYGVRPEHWPKFQPYTPPDLSDMKESSSSEDRLFDTDEEFELL